VNNDPSAVTRAKVAASLKLLSTDPAFAVVRDENQALELLAAQRAAWRQFWLDVHELEEKIKK